MRHNRNFAKSEDCREPSPLSTGDAERLKLLVKLASPEVRGTVKGERKIGTARDANALHLYLTKDGLLERGTYPDQEWDYWKGDMGGWGPVYQKKIHHLIEPSINLVRRYNLSKNELECHLSMLGLK